MTIVPRIAAVVIGRNEGARLVRCLVSLKDQVDQIVYVDSGSTDNSLAAAIDAGATTVELDTNTPFTAARARNAGFEILNAASPKTEFVQFVDGDCVVEQGWIASAAQALSENQSLGIVTGWRRETDVSASVYNAMFEVEWHRPAGLIKACGGDMMVRFDVFQSVGGFNPNVIAAEDDEFCVRVRKSGKEIERLPLQMTLHDAAMTRLSQWWRRTLRSGHGFAQVGHLHPEHFASERRRVWVYGGFLPLLVIIGLTSGPKWLLIPVAAAYVLSYWRTVSGLRKLDLGLRDALHQSLFLTLSKIPNMIGMLTYWFRHFRGAPMRIIEYKHV